MSLGWTASDMQKLVLMVWKSVPMGRFGLPNMGLDVCWGREDKGLVAALQVDAQYVTNIAFGPNGLAAMTGAKDNRFAPFPGATWVFPAQGLTDAVLTEDEK